MIYTDTPPPNSEYPIDGPSETLPPCPPGTTSTYTPGPLPITSSSPGASESPSTTGSWSDCSSSVEQVPRHTDLAVTGMDPLALVTWAIVGAAISLAGWAFLMGRRHRAQADSDKAGVEDE